MKTVFGLINENGGIVINGGGITSAERLGTGKYKVQFASDIFSSNPVVQATVYTSDNDCGSGGTNRTISVTGYSTTEICVAIRTASADNTNSDRPFSFLAMG